MIFMLCSCSTQELDLSNFDTHNTTSMCNMFNAADIPRINLKSFDTSNVTDMSNMFEDCTTDELDLSNFNTHGIRTTYKMFNGLCCKTLDIRGLHVIKNSSLFDNCETELITDDVEIENMFKHRRLT